MEERNYDCPVDVSIHLRRARGVHASGAKRRGGIFLPRHAQPQILESNGRAGLAVPVQRQGAADR